MLRIEEIPETGTVQDLDLEKYNSTTKVKISDAVYAGKAVLVSFVEYDNGRGWLTNLQSTFANLPANCDIIAVLFKYSGSLPSKLIIQTAIGTGYSFPILVDNTWGDTSSAKKYWEAFNFTEDPSFIGNAGSTMWSFILQKNHKVADKWHTNCTANGDPVSLRRLPPAGSFTSTDYANTETRVTQRLTNLCNPPKILYTVPAMGSVVSPAALQQVEVVFSKPVGEVPAKNPANYVLEGAGSVGLSVDPAVYYENRVDAAPYAYPLNAGKIENVAIFKIAGLVTLDPGSLWIQVNKSGGAVAKIADTENVPAQLDGNYKGATLQAFFTIPYNGPQIAGVIPNPATIVTSPASLSSMTFTFTDTVCHSAVPGTALAQVATGDVTVQPNDLVGGPVTPAVPPQAIDADLLVNLNGVAGLTGTGTLDVTLSNVTDEYGRPLLGDAKKTYSIDTVQPLIVSITSTTLSGHYKAGSVINITINFNRNVTLAAGNLEIDMSSGATVYISAPAGPANSLSCSYTVQDGDNTPAGEKLDVDDIALGVGATLRDGTGKDANLAVPALTNLSSTKDIRVDTVRPVVQSVTADPAIGTCGIGDTIEITVTFSEEVTLSAGGTLTVNLNSGGSANVSAVAYPSASLKGTYAVAASQNALALDSTGCTLTGGTLRDRAGNDADLTVAPTETIQDGGTLVIDTVLPTITSITSGTTNSTYHEYASINIRVLFSEPVTLSGGRLLVTLDTGAVVPVSAAVYPASTFDGTYTVLPGHNSLDLDSTLVNLASFDGSAASLQNAAGEDADLGLPASTLAYNKNIIVSTSMAPTVERHIVLALDHSGSMTSQVTIEGETKTKIDFVKDAVSQFLAKLQPFNGPNDLCGAVYYHSVASPSPLGMQGIETSLGVVAGEIAGYQPGGLTAMGAGLANALDFAGYPAPPATFARYILLFADGQQNVTPYVQFFDGNTRLTIDTTSGSASASIPPGMGTIEVRAEDAAKIPIHSVGIGYNQPWLDTLMNIAAIAGGSFRANQQLWPGLENGLTDLLQTIYAGSSPQVVKLEQGRLEAQPPEPEAEHSFQVNRSARKLLVCVSWVGGVPLTFELYRDGSPVTLPDPIEEPSYRICVLEFSRPGAPLAYLREGTPLLAVRAVAALPAFGTLQPAAAAEVLGQLMSGSFSSAESEWTLVVRRRFAAEDADKPAPYNISVLVEEKELDVRITGLPSAVFTGDLLPFELRLGEAGAALDTVYSVQAEIQRPIIGMGDLLSAYKGPAGKAKTEERPDSEPLSVKLQSLLQDQAMRKKLAEVKTTAIALGKADRRGVFSGGSEDTRVPGVYTATFRIKGVGAKSGVFERTLVKSVLVRVKPDLKASVARASIAQSHRLSLLITPKDGFGNRLGPGYAARMSLKLREQAGVRVIDNLDGTYTIEAGLNPKMRSKVLKPEVRVVGWLVYRGSIPVPSIGQEETKRPAAKAKRKS